MEVNLVVASGKNAGQKIAVTGPKFFIGRAEDCHLRPHSDLVSRHHCAIIIEEGYVGVRDFGSKNGTFVNGQQVRPELELKNGDRLKIGQLEFDVELAVSVSGKKKPKVQSVEEAAARTAESRVEDDLDVTSWLEDSETSTGSSAQSETKAIPGTPNSDVPPLPEEAELPEEEESDPDYRVDPAAGWKGIKKQPEGTSRDAAANVLKSLFNRR